MLRLVSRLLMGRFSLGHHLSGCGMPIREVVGTRFVAGAASLSKRDLHS